MATALVNTESGRQKAPPTLEPETRTAPVSLENPPFVSVIIPVHNDLDRLKICLQALDKQTYPYDRYEVIVVDNRSQPPVASVIAPSSSVRIVLENTPGSYVARNRGIACATGEILAFTDSDCIPLPDWLEKGVTRLNQAQGCGMVAGKVDLFPADPENPTPVEQYDQLFYLDQEIAISKGHYGATANLFTYRSVIEDVGPFNPQLKSSGDNEWGNRVYRNGYKQVYSDEACVRHPARSSLYQLYRKTVRITGGLHDVSAHKSEAFSRFLLREAKMWKPPIGRVAGILWGKTGKKLSSPRQRLAVAWITLLLHYSRRIEFLRLALGGQSKNC